MDDKPGGSHKYRAEIPNIVDEMDLSVYAYRVFGHLKRLADENKPMPGTRAIAEHCNIAIGSVIGARRELITAGLILWHGEVDPLEAKRIICCKVGQQLQDPYLKGKVCSWCHGSTIVLHNHHFPIPKSEGGTKTVVICPNCHMEYHMLIQGVYILTELAYGH